MSKLNVKISIIIPVHNTPDKYLRECLDSIFAQTFSDWELIIVDDGSDCIDTINAINEFSNSYLKGISLITLDKVKGAGEARNIGFKEAIGEYVIFLDSDDIFDREMLSKMYSSAVHCQADVTISGYDAVNENYPVDDEIIFSRNLNANRKGEAWLAEFPLNPWTKLVKRDYLNNNEIRFQNLSSCNDVYYSAMVMLLSDRISVLDDERLVKYRVRETGNISASRNPHNIYLAIEKVLEDLKKRKALSDEFVRDVVAILLKSGVLELQNSNDIRMAKLTYEKGKDLLKNISYKDSMLERLRLLWINENFEVQWFKHYGDYEFFLKLNTKTLINEINNKEIYLWGLGKRGQAFISWAKENKIKIKATYDKNISEEVARQYFDILFITEDEMLSCNGIIIATNEKIYKSIETMVCGSVMDLEKYCPI